MTQRQDPFDLERFVSAQRETFETALSELRNGAKRSHWMWFVFPQVAGLGSSTMAQRYAIRGRAEAAAYLAHPVLGPRLVACAHALLEIQGKSAREIMGDPDWMKLQSSMTLFAAITERDSPFERVLARYYGGQTDPRTLDFLTAHE